MHALLSLTFDGTITSSHQLIALLIATGLGSVIGLERELGAQPAGFRTHVLVAIGASLFTIVGADLPGSDPTRVAAQVVTGIGFLGAGAILRDGASIKGLTTAASLWVTAAAGVACGLDRPLLATTAVGITLLALIGLKQLERDYFPRRRVHTLVLEVVDTADLATVVRHTIDLLQVGASVRKVERGSGDRTVVTMTSQLAHGFSLVELAGGLRALEGVVGVELSA